MIPTTLRKKTNVQLFWNTLDRILIEIEGLRLTLGDLHFKSPRYHRQIKMLERLVFGNRGTPLEEEILSDSRFDAYAVRTRRIYDGYEVHDEYKSRRQLLETTSLFARPAGKGIVDSLLDMSPPIQRTYQYAFLEAVLGDLRANSLYCHIGCGSFPETLMAIDSYTKGRGSLAGIDIDSNAVLAGETFVKRFGVHGIRFIAAAGDVVDYAPFTHIHLAVLVRPEQRVIRQICETAAKTHDVSLLLRSAYGLGSLIYQPLSEATKRFLVQHGFDYVDTLRGHAIMQTELYRKIHA